MLGSPHSMTGFGRAVQAYQDFSVECQMRGVNHRYLDIVLRLPRSLVQSEQEIRNRVQKELRRGRVEVTFTITGKSQTASDNRSIEEHLRQFALLSERYAVKDPAAGALLAQLILRTEFEPDQEAVPPEELALQLTDEALQQLVKFRVVEGKALTEDIIKRVSRLYDLLNKVEERRASATNELFQRAIKRAEALSNHLQVEPSRMAMELAMLSERSDVAEELTRARAHLDQLKASLESRAEGRKLDFFAQELNRECTTIASKAQDSQLQALSVEARVEIERIREQVQNLE